MATGRFVAITLLFSSALVQFGDLKVLKSCPSNEVATTYINENADPCEDFHEYACGNWARLNGKLADDTFGLAEDNVKNTLKDILEKAKFRNSGRTAVGAQNFYRACVESAKMSKADSMKPYLDALKAIADWPILNSAWSEWSFNLFEVLGQFRLYGINALISEVIKPNWKNATEDIVYLTQPKFKFITRADLLDSTSPVSEEYIFLYKRYLKSLLLDLGLKVRKASAVADEIFNFETSLAEVMENENDMSIEEPESLSGLRVGGLDLRSYFQTLLGSGDLSSVKVVAQRPYLEKLGKLLANTDKETVAKYLLFKFLLDFNVNLNENDWKSCLKEVDSKFGPVVFDIFMEYGNLDKSAVQSLYEQLRQQLRSAINDADWMDDATKSRALTKLNSIRIHLGYPDNVKPEDIEEYFDGFDFNQPNYHKLLLSLNKFLTQKEHAQLYASDNEKLPVGINLKINGFYKLTENAIHIPFGLMQPPFFHACFERAVNFGGFGTILGHEITHGFDYNGQNYDKAGNLENWWTAKSIIGFGKRAQCFLDQYENGQRTVNENIADNGGIKLAYDAYKSGARATNDRAFFLSFAQLWCTSGRGSGNFKEHTSHKDRVNNVMANLPKFAEAFKCRAGSKLNPAKRCQIW